VTAAIRPTNTIKTRHIAQLLLLSLIWGSAYLFTRSAVPQFGPISIVALRMTIAVLVLLPILAARGGLPLLRQHAAQFALQGTLLTALSFCLIAYAALSVSAGLAAILSATAPMFGALVAWLFMSERIGRWRIVGLVLGMIGVTILVWGKVSLRLDASSVRLSLAILAGLASSLVWGIAANYTRSRLSGIDSIATTTGTMLAASIALAPLAYWEWHGAVQAGTAVLPSFRACLEALFLGVVCSGVGMLMYFRLLRDIGTVPTMSVTFMSPVVAIIMGALYLGEVITLQVVIGCVVVLFGTALSVGLLPRPRSKPATTR
jgi:drug/metabolite transporter (DMT)-like permease